ncbi:MAG: sigma-70 region 4 domain-containing protein [Candidatus Omnitrophica bacterium]|nr:sigma-70 region 4 domain-containing protein [Candidatus Omnitrophota bacterium]
MKSKQDLERVLWQLAGKDNWAILQEIDNWLFIFDKMPKKMRLIVDFRVQGLTNKEIAIILHCSENNIRAQLSKAKKRILRGESCESSQGNAIDSEGHNG